MSKPFLVTEDSTQQFKDLIDSFKYDSVLVGIPAEDNSRKQEQGESSTIGNAALMFINNFGSPINNIPPRPVMEIGIKRAQERIAEEYKKALKSSFKKGLSALGVYYERVGIIASNSIKGVINDQIGIQEPAESTLKTRKSQGFGSKKALLVTAQLRNAITYVVKGK